MNEQVLAAIESAARWTGAPNGVDILIKNTCATILPLKPREKKIEECLPWEPRKPGDSIRDLLLNIPIYWWPIPRGDACFHANCSFKLAAHRNRHLQQAHGQKRKISEEPDFKDKKDYVWDGESSLQTTTADLLGITMVSPSSTKYINPYEFERDEVKKVTSFKALTEIWHLPDIKDWHQRPGNWWGPLIKHLRESNRWPSIGEIFDTAYPHGYVLKGYGWRRPDCVPIPDKRKIFHSFIQGVEEIYRTSGLEVPINLAERINVRGLQTHEKLSIPIPPRAEETLGEEQVETLSEEELKSCENLDEELEEMHHRIIAWTIEGGPDLSRNLEILSTHQKEKWACATAEQKEIWGNRKQLTFAQNPLNTRPEEVLASFESRWLPQEHNVCPICWEQGTTIHFRQGDEFKKHMKDIHKVGWRNVKDVWYTMFSEAMGVTIVTKGEPERQGAESIELSNNFLACPHHNCKWTHAHGLDHHKHYGKAHENIGTPAMGIWSTFVDILERNPEATVGDFLGKTSGFMCLCDFFSTKEDAVRSHMESHPRGRYQIEKCVLTPVYRTGEGDDENPMAAIRANHLVDEIKETEWTHEKAEMQGRQWHRDLMEEFEKGVVEKHILRGEAKFIRREGSFPKVHLRKHSTTLGTLQRLFI